MYGGKDRIKYGLMNEWMDGWMDGWMVTCIHGCIDGGSGRHTNSPQDCKMSVIHKSIEKCLKNESLC